jgi:hypothetical protein
VVVRVPGTHRTHAASESKAVLNARPGLRHAGDTVFMIGPGALAYFMIGLRTGWSYEPEGATVAEELPGSVPSLGD